MRRLQDWTRWMVADGFGEDEETYRLTRVAMECNPAGVMADI